MNPRTIAIIGGGPAGSTAAEKLATGWAGRGAGAHRVLVFEEKLGWEKPCGGGLTHKALRRYPFLAQATSGGNLLRDAEFIAATGDSIHFHLRSPLAIYSRATLNQLLLRRAEDAGAEVVVDRILRVRPASHGWEIEGRDKTYSADFVILAAGARSRLRQTFAEDFTPRDFMLTFGYYLRVPCECLRVQFYHKFEGYCWAFPRPDHVSVGIGAKMGEGTMGELRERLGVFLSACGYAPDPGRIYSHLLPSLSIESWKKLRLAGKGWALAGDAGGLVDPVTGEGIYYAMRSGELLAETLLEEVPHTYPERVRKDFGRCLALGARLTNFFYHGEFLGSGVTTRMVQFGRRSQKTLGLLQDLVDGTQSYPGLVLRLRKVLAHGLVEAGVRRLRGAFDTGSRHLPTP
jgi:flavin-dependent dehydrogenase